MTFEEVKKFNPYHGSDGRFTTGAKATSFTYKPGHGKMYDNAIAREKERTKDWKNPTPKISKPLLSAEKMPKLFTKTKPATKSMQNFCNAINACKEADPDCVKVLSKVSTDVYDQNGVQQAISNAKSHSVCTSSYAGQLRNIKIVIPKVPDKNNVSEVVTTSHELTHFIDVTIGGSGVKATYSSSKNQSLMNAVKSGRNSNENVSDETAAFFKDLNDQYHKIVADEQAKFSQVKNDIRGKYGLSPIGGKSIFNLSTDEYNAYVKEVKAAERNRSEAISRTFRQYGGGGATSLSDMYDAMCAGSKRMKGTSLISGHSTSYYAYVENRVEELVANFVAIGATNPKLLKHFERDYPAVYKEIRSQVHNMAES